MHPRIRERWQAQAAAWRREDCRVGVVVIPLLFETRAEALFDKVVCVACSSVSQLQRLRARGWNDEQIRQRLAAQWPVETKIARADFAVYTEGTLDVHRQQWQQILKKSDFRSRADRGRLL